MTKTGGTLSHEDWLARHPKSKAVSMECLECGQVFDLLNSYWSKPEANSRWLHVSGTGHEHYKVTFADGTSKGKIQRRALNTLEGKRLQMKVAK